MLHERYILCRHGEVCVAGTLRCYWLVATELLCIYDLTLKWLAVLLAYSELTQHYKASRIKGRQPNTKSGAQYYFCVVGACEDAANNDLLCGQSNFNIRFWLLST